MPERWPRTIRPSFLVLVALGAAIATLASAVRPSLFWDPPWLILLGNTVFVTGVGVAVAYLALRTFSFNGRIQLLLLGGGVLTFGVAAGVAAAARSFPGGANLNVTIYNLGALMGAALHALATFLLLSGASPDVSLPRRRTWIAVGVLAAGGAVAIVTGAALGGLLPPFFVQGVGPTAMRQRVLGAADVLFLFSAAVACGTYLRTREPFLYWYASALALSALSLTAFALQSSVGSPVGWLGRLSQYVGGVYFLVALANVARVARLRGTSPENVLTSALTGAEEKFRALAENAPDVIRRFDRELNHIYVNVACERLYGKPATAYLGRGMDAAGVPPDQARRWAERLRRVFETGAPEQAEEDLDTAAGPRFYASLCVPEHGADGAVANVLVLSRDLTDRKRGEERTQRQNAVLAGIARIFGDTLGADTEEAVGRTCLTVAMDVTRSGFGFLGELDAVTGRLDDVAISDTGWAACGQPDPAGHGRRLPTGLAVTGLYGRVLRDGASLVANDPAAHPDRAGTPPGHPPLTAFLGVPLKRDGRTVGLIGLANRPGGYGPADVEVAEFLAPAVVQALERKRAEKAVRESERRFRLLFESTSDGVCLHDHGGVVREVNDAYCAMSGYARDELRGMRIERLEAIEGPADVAARVRRIAATGHDRFESRHRRKDGTTFDLDVTALHLPGNGDERIALFVRDITERRHAASFAEALNVIGQLVHATRDLDEIMRSALQSAAAALGASTAAVSLRDGGRWIVRYAHGLPAQVLGATMRDDEERHAVLAIEQRRPVAVSDALHDARVNREHLAAFGIRSVLVVPLIVRGQAIGVCFFNYQGAPVELGPAHLDFAVKLGSSMSLAVENARLFMDLQEGTRRRDEFLGMLSHELRNPLAPIHNSLFVLERAPPGSEPVARARQVIRRQTEHLTRLVDDLLDVTRIARGKIELHRARLDLGELLRRVCDDHRSVLQQHEMSLALDVAGAVWVDADETRLSQVMGNLLQNAARFGRHGGTVSVSAGADGPRAWLRVRDDGLGIAPEVLPHVFEPFVQAEHDLARTKGGLGLGLALVKGLVELHGGAVTARSEGTGRGAEFLVTLPRVATPDEVGVTAGGPTRAPTGLRVLVVDDNADEAASLSDALALGGHRVAVAHDGAEALERARAFLPSVILCDIGLPRMNGFEVARAVRRDPGLAGVCLIALTGYARPEDVAATREAGFDHHLAKPASIPDLERAMSAVAALPPT
jgi:PAS domain S-box-containing protein